MCNSPALRCEALTAYYDSVAVLRNVDLKIPRSKLVLLVGPNGSGKTTLLRIFRGLHKQFGIRFEGDLRFDNAEIADEPPESLGKKIGIVFQRPSLQLLNLTVSEEIQIGLVFRGLSWETVIERSNNFIDRLGLGDVRDNRVFELSGGEQARTVVAAILSAGASLLLLDEPGSYFDPRSKSELLRDLKSLTGQGVTVVMTSHRMEDELRFADHVVVLSYGKIVAEGSPEDVVFTETVNRILPPRGFLTVSYAMWKSGLVPHKILDPSQLPTQVKSSDRGPYSPRKEPDLVEFRSVSVRYPNSVLALRDVSATLKEKCINLILGPNGSGKTTLAKACVGILKPSKGKVMIQGQDIRRVGKDQISELMSYSAAEPADILFERSVRDELLLGSSSATPTYSGYSFDEIVTRLELDDLLDDHPECLSAGQQKRLTVAIALRSSPRLIILDEPTIGLDSSSVDALVDLMNDLRRRTSIAVITHDLDVFLPLCDHVLVLEAGALVVQGNPRKVFTEELANRLHLKVPELWETWKSLPHIKSWKEMAAQFVRNDKKKVGRR